jgi:hypothetical protein
LPTAAVGFGGHRFERPHRNQIDDTVEPGPGAEREMQRQRPCAPRLGDRADATVEVGGGMIESGHQAQPRHLMVVGHPQDRLESRGARRRGVQDHDRAVGHPDGSFQIRQGRVARQLGDADRVFAAAGHPMDHGGGGGPRMIAEQAPDHPRRLGGLSDDRDVADRLRVDGSDTHRG